VELDMPDVSVSRVKYAKGY